MKTYKTLTKAVAFALIFSFLFSFIRFESACDDVRRNVLRLHVLANSDSEEDQALKLKVRDELLKVGNSIFGISGDLAQAEQLVTDNLEVLQKTAQKTVNAEGYGYSVNVQLAKTEFTTRHYADITLPAGEYDAVQVVIGEGKGQNWWCVMFPPLCVPAAKAEDLSEVVGENGREITENHGEYVAKFKIIEVYEAIKSKFSKEK